MPRTDQVLGLGILGNGREDSPRTIGSRDTRSYSVAGIHRNSEGRTKGRRVLMDHHGELQLLHLPLHQGEAYESPAVPGHEVDGLWRHQLGSHGQIALILPGLVV